MKKNVFAAMIFASFMVNAFTEEAFLWSSITCKHFKLKCRSNENWMQDQHKRCNCLRADAYTPISSVCETMTCDQELQVSMSYLYDGNGKLLGCGCFKTRA